MTRVGSCDTVSLSIRDWFGIIASVATVLVALMGVYLHHDRALTKIGTRQDIILERLNKVEDLVDNTWRSP
jgi:hypothetical protein